MLALAGLPLGLSFRFLDPSPDACAAEVGELVVAPYDDLTGLDRLVEGTAVVTYEFENVPVAAAERVGAVPGARSLEEGQDRLREKELFRSLGIPTVRFGTLAETGVPALVKTRRLGYDGKGQRRVTDLQAPVDDAELAEELAAFDRELSIVQCAVLWTRGASSFACKRPATSKSSTASTPTWSSDAITAPQIVSASACDASRAGARVSRRIPSRCTFSPTGQNRISPSRARTPTIDSSRSNAASSSASSASSTGAWRSVTRRCPFPS